MTRSTLNPELRVKTTQPVARVKPLDTDDKTRQAIARSFAHVAQEMRRETYATDGEIEDGMISTLAYKAMVPVNMSGRPTLYNRCMPQIVFNFALLGLTDERIAKAMGIDVTTFYQWVKAYPEFSQALIDGRENADGIVINALFKRATGFKYQSTKIFHNKDDGTVYAPYEEYVVPDVTAAKYLLSVRRGRMRKDGWEDTPEPSDTPTSPAVSITINATDPVEAMKAYQKVIQGN